MIVTVTLNAAVDKTYRIPGFRIGEVHRPEQYWLTAGGKGVNVARVHHTMGGTAFATGFAAGRNGRFITDSLSAADIDNEFVWLEGESRVCIAAIDPVTNTQTEINELGPFVTDADFSKLVDEVGGLLSEHHVDFLVLCGSLPPGAPQDAYRTLIQVARQHNVRAVLDTSGEPLRLGIEAKPWMVKPNDKELSWLAGCEQNSLSALTHAAQELLQSGLDVVCVTQGAEGAFLLAANEAWQAAPPNIDFVSAVGSGDSFLGAMLTKMLDSRGNSFSEALRTGVGAGAANAETYGAGLCTRQAIEARVAQTVVRRME